MLWNEPNNLSHWDFKIDPEWKLFSEMVIVAARAIRACMLAELAQKHLQLLTDNISKGDYTVHNQPVLLSPGPHQNLRRLPQGRHDNVLPAVIIQISKCSAAACYWFAYA